jgi:hypothetical protein
MPERRAVCKLILCARAGQQSFVNHGDVILASQSGSIQTLFATLTMDVPAGDVKGKGRFTPAFLLFGPVFTAPLAAMNPDNKKPVQSRAGLSC